MHFDDQAGMDSPVQGLGSEMLPDKGLPFDDIEDEIQETDIIGDGTDDEGDELISLDALPELEDLVDDIAESEEDQRDKEPPVQIPEFEVSQDDTGMGAASPIISDEDLPEEVPLANAEMPVPTVSSAEAMPVFSDDAHMDPGLSSGSTKRDILMPAEIENLGQELSVPGGTGASRDRVMSMWERIDIVFQDVKNNVPSPKIAAELGEKIERAKRGMIEDVNNLSQVELIVNEVELKVSSINRARKDNKIAIGLFCYELFMALILFLAFIGLGAWVRDFILVAIGTEALANFPTLASDTIILINSGIAGGYGGIAAALFSLWRHVTQKVDFSRQYSIWYLSSPFTGFIIGVIGFIIVRVIVFSLFVGSGGMEIRMPYMIYFLAILGGLLQNSIWDMVRRVGKAITAD